MIEKVINLSECTKKIFKIRTFHLRRINILDSTDTKAPLALKNLELLKNSFRNISRSINSKNPANEN